MKLNISKAERTHILIAWLVISLAFAWRGFFNFSVFFSRLPAVLLATSTAFIFHELAHKFTAIHYKAKARFFMWKSGLFFAVLISLMTGGGFVFAAPGAVYIWGKDLTVKENGVISYAGPLSNIIIALLFFILALFFSSPFIVSIFMTVIFVNLFLAAFNLLPFGPLDGYKVFLWNKALWFLTFLPLIGLIILFF